MSPYRHIKLLLMRHLKSKWAWLGHVAFIFDFWATICKTVRPMLSVHCPVCPVCLFVWKHVLDGVHIGATWRIWLNSPCAAAMRHFCQSTLATYLWSPYVIGRPYIFLPC